MAGFIPNDARTRLRVSHNWSEIRDEWPCLADVGPRVSGFPFQTREWIDAWIHIIGPNPSTPPFFAIVETLEGTPIAFFPLQIWRRNGVRTVQFIGKAITDYSAPLLVPGYDFAEIGEAFWSGLLENGPAFDVVYLKHVPAFVGESPNPCRTLGHSASPMQARVATLSGDWKSFYERTHSKSTRSKLRRKFQNMAELGDVSFKTASSVDEALQILEYLFKMKSNLMLAEDNSLSVPEHAEFYREMTRSCPDAVHVHALTVGDEIVAALWSISTQGYYTSLLASHAGGDWSRFSPGLLAFEKAFAWCFEQGFKVYDFGLGDEAYKFRWCDREMQLGSVIRARSLLGHAAAYHLRRKEGKAIAAPVMTGALAGAP
ncbi:MAG: acetyltransferase domain protein [Hyphomicrobiales bacterium]|nr:acetyltransferase domain protein [Hyphomicrobiales bacterium]